MKIWFGFGLGLVLAASAPAETMVYPGPAGRRVTVTGSRRLGWTWEFKSANGDSASKGVPGVISGGRWTADGAYFAALVTGNSTDTFVTAWTEKGDEVTAVEGHFSGQMESYPVNCPRPSGHWKGLMWQGHRLSAWVDRCGKRYRSACSVETVGGAVLVVPKQLNDHHRLPEGGSPLGGPVLPPKDIP